MASQGCSLGLPLEHALDVLLSSQADHFSLRLCSLQEAGEAALLCLACEGEAKSAPRRILVVRIAQAQQPEQQPLQVRQQRLGLVGAQKAQEPDQHEIKCTAVSARDHSARGLAAAASGALQELCSTPAGLL